jgi:hypothetical protein
MWTVVGASPHGTSIPFAVGFRVLSFKAFLPADPPGPDQKRKKHLVQLWTDPGGMRTLSVGSLRLKDPNKTGEVKRPERQLAAGATEEDE